MNDSRKRACVTCHKQYVDGVSVCPDDGSMTTPVEKTDPMIGTVLADVYEMLDVIAGGGMGVVYKAKHRLMKRIVAIKMLHQHMAASPDALKRFHKEAQAQSALNHPNILQIFDFGVAPGGRPYMVMDYLEGATLDEVLRDEGPMPVPRAIHVCAQICAGLYHAHQKGIIHRDLKPANIVLVSFEGKSDYVKVVDFGIAKLLAQEEGTVEPLTKPGEVFGSPLYMSPEQCRGKELDCRSDIYSMGCVAYKVLTGRGPFTSPDIVECMMKQVSEEPPPFSQIDGKLDIPAELESAVKKALMKEPDDRYQSMQDFKEALENVGRRVRTPEHKPAAEERGAPFMVATEEEAKTMKPKAPGDAVTPAVPTPALPLEKVKSASPPKRQSGDDRTRPTQIPPSEKVEGTKSSRPSMTSTRSRAMAPPPGRRILSWLFSPPSLIAALVLAFAMGSGMIFQNSRRSYEFYMQRADKEVDQGKYDLAEKDFVEAGKLARKKGLDDPSVADNLLKRGWLHFEEQRYEDAERDFLDAVQVRRTCFGNISPQVAEALSALGVAYSAQDKFSRAESALEDAQVILEKHAGPDSLEVAEDLYGLGDLALKQKQFPKALDLAKRSVSIREKNLGANDPELADSLILLGQVHQFTGNFDQARTCYQRALQIRQQSIGPHTPKVADALLCLGTLLFQENHFNEAEHDFKTALDIEEKTVGKDDLACGQLCFCLGVLYDQKGDYSLAEPFLKRAYIVRTEMLGPRDPLVSHTRAIYAGLLVRLGKKAEAQALMEQKAVIKDSTIDFQPK